MPQQARDVNIFPPEDSGKEIKAFEGREFFTLPPKKQLEMLKEDNIVFCRAEPADKQKLVKMLQSLNEIPAMTGDGKHVHWALYESLVGLPEVSHRATLLLLGVNDAPALQQAAIGVAMG